MLTLFDGVVIILFDGAFKDRLECVSLSQLLDALTSVLFLYVDPHHGCFWAGVTVLIVGFFGALSAVIGTYFTTPANSIVGTCSFVTNLLTLVLGIVVVCKGKSFKDCQQPVWQGFIVWPAFVTAIAACLCID